MNPKNHSLIGKTIRLKSYKGKSRGDVGFVYDVKDNRLVNLQVFAVENDARLIKYRSFFLNDLVYEEVKAK